MNKVQTFLEEKLLPAASKIQSNIYISAVSDGFSQILVVILMGAIFTLLASLQLDVYQSFIQMTHLKTIFSYASAVTTDMIAIYTTMSVAYQLTVKKGFSKEAPIVAFITVAMFLLMIPLGVQAEAKESKELVSITAALATEYLGSKGLFSAMILGLVVPSIYVIFPKRGITIKLPSSVAPTIAKSFAALIPGFVVLAIFSVVRFVFAMTSYGDFNSFVYQIIAKPLGNLGNSPISMIVLVLVAQILWVIGIHGYLVIRPFLQVIYMPLALENLTAFQAGEALPNMITYQHYGTYMNLGGSGALLGLAILMAFVAKSKRYKTLGRLGLPSTICSINEPIIFGTPIVLNPIMAIPFIVTPVISFIIPYVLQCIGILPTLRGISLPLGTPAILYGWLGGGMPVAIMQLILIVLQIIIYYPFFKVLDSKAVLEEQEEV